MFKIGEFARLSGVNAKRLRHYDDLGLFRPAWVDPESGYRFYSPAQLPELYRILALRNLGIRLAEVTSLIQDGTDLATVLARRRAELVAEREALDRRLRALDIRVDPDPGAAYSDVVIRRLESELVAGLRVELGPGAGLEPVFNELEAHVRDHGRRAPRPPATLVHAEQSDGRRDVEAVVPILRPLESTARIVTRRLETRRCCGNDPSRRLRRPSRSAQCPDGMDRAGRPRAGGPVACRLSAVRGRWCAPGAHRLSRRNRQRLRDRAAATRRR